MIISSFFSTNYIIYQCYYFNGDKMKKIVKSIMVPVIMSMLFGFVCGKYIYSIYKDDIQDKFNSSLVYLLEGDTYLTYDGMRKENGSENYVYYVDDKGYKTVFGITKDKDNVNKINDLYNDGLNVFEYYVSNDKLNDKQEEYDTLLKNSRPEDMKKVLNNILDMYKEDDTIRLVLIDQSFF